MLALRNDQIELHGRAPFILQEMKAGAVWLSLHHGLWQRNGDWPRQAIFVIFRQNRFPPAFSIRIALTPLLVLRTTQRFLPFRAVAGAIFSERTFLDPTGKMVKLK